MGSRAAVFTQRPQDVEVYVDGVWRLGSMLGWRHEGGGVCRAWVRVTADGVERTAWTDLVDLRLPQRRLTVAPESPAGVEWGAMQAEPPVSLSQAAARERRAVAALSAAESPGGAQPSSLDAARRRRRAADVTAEMPAVRSGDSPGRHRAPSMVGRHRAAEEAPAAVVAEAPALRADDDCLTRPLRLGNGIPRPRAPRPDGALSR
ncbi:hypothetical protein SAMN04488085_10252 [Geodermatophilus ruber]|uniref:Uncharacterized protein n=1 Tax=Geodermatophilus ruber TaxID=504800 RepID=A0A1I4A2Y3_9ACTN|nr:hypothetical protein SAMN04488085_10252 [Geodermatophilus ruber]